MMMIDFASLEQKFRIIEKLNFDSIIIDDKIYDLAQLYNSSFFKLPW
jgi:hypothetical protein